jgi:chromosome segregation ATPase
LFGSGPVSFYRAQMAIINSARERSAESDGRLTTIAIQAELANTKAANQRLRQQIRALERRLGELLGIEADSKMTPLQTLAAPAAPSQADLAQLSATIDDLRSVIAERDQDLQAARRLNADLTRQLNQPTGNRTPSSTRSSQPTGA